MSAVQKLTATKFFANLPVGLPVQLYLPSAEYRALTVSTPTEELVRVQIAGLEYASDALCTIVCDAAERIRAEFSREPDAGDRVTIVKLADGSIRALR
jgi:hypothetical protein